MAAPGLLRVDVLYVSRRGVVRSTRDDVALLLFAPVVIVVVLIMEAMEESFESVAAIFLDGWGEIICKSRRLGSLRAAARDLQNAVRWLFASLVSRASRVLSCLFYARYEVRSSRTACSKTDWAGAHSPR